MTTELYLYGIFPSPGPKDLNLQGLDKQPVQTQDIDGFVFLYSEAQQVRYLPSRKNLLSHERVLEQAMELGHRTLLPLQFGLVINNWESVRENLTVPKEQDLKQLFSKLEGCREVSIKILWDQDSELEKLMKENTTLRAERDRLEGKTLNMDEVVKIGQVIERAITSQKQHIIESIRETLNPLAIEVVENDPMGEAMIYNTAYLIPWDAEPQFGEKVEALDRQFENRLRIRYNNLTAPFNFAQLG